MGPTRRIPSDPARRPARAGAVAWVAASIVPALMVTMPPLGSAVAEEGALLRAPPAAQAPEPLVAPDPRMAPDPSADPSASDDDEPAAASRPEPAPAPLRIVSWHLDDAKAAGALAMLPEPDRAWRHTFGAERFTPPASSFDAASFAADIVLLQGVRRPGDARLLFPAREWRLIVSRQALAPVLAAAPGQPFTAPGAPRPATTAIAVRLQRRLRITGREQVTGVVVPVPAADGAGESAAAVAVRLLADGRPLWVASADLTGACPAGADAAAKPCPASALLADWLTQRGPGVLVGGRDVSPRAAGGGGEPCARQSIADAEMRAAPARHEPAYGCLARLLWPPAVP